MNSKRTAPPPSSKDQRDNLRLPVESDLSFSIQGLHGSFLFTRFFQAKIVNISSTGICFEPLVPLGKKTLRQLVTTPRLFRLRFDLPSLPLHFSVMARPVYLKQRSASQSVIGLQFTSLKEKEKRLLQDYIVLKRATFLRDILIDLEKKGRLRESSPHIQKAVS